MFEISRGCSASKTTVTVSVIDRLSSGRGRRWSSRMEAMNHREVRASMIAAIVLLATFGTASAQDAAKPAITGPIFSNTGPDAAAYYGAAEGFPLGTLATASQMRHLVASYSHFDELTPARIVARAAVPWSFKRAAEPEISYSFLGKRHTIMDYLSRYPTTGLLLTRDDIIFYEHYQYARSDRDRFLSQSMAKTITAMLIGIAAADGAIKSIDDEVATYVAGLTGTEYGKTPIRALLHMSSGVDFKVSYNGQDDVARLGRDLVGGKDPVVSVAQFNTRVAPSGTRFHYASAETEIRNRQAGCRLSEREDLAVDWHGGRRLVGDRQHRPGGNLLLLQRCPARLRPFRALAGA